MERELWTVLYAVTMKFALREGAWKFSTGDIVLTYFWAALHDRPMSWAVDKDHWPPDLCPVAIPSQSTLSRRMRRSDAQQLMTEIEAFWLVATQFAMHWIMTLDAKPLAVSGVTKDRDARYGRGAGGKQKGYKFLAAWADGPLPVAWALAPMNKSEKTIARDLIPTLPGAGYLLGDAEYDSNPLHDLAHAHGYQLLTPKRRKNGGLGHHRHSPYRLRSIELMKQPFGKALFSFRRQIERNFGNLTSFGGGLTCLPAWARRFHRVRNWVHAKLLINAARWINKHRPALALA
jgi:hypothetical protein